MKEDDQREEQASGDVPGRVISPAAERALSEAAARRALADAGAVAASEAGGPKGLEPTRYGDWERKGLAIDF